MTIRFTIQQLIDISNKNKEMTLKENDYLQECINILKTYATNIIVPEKVAKECIEHDAVIREDVLNGKIKEYCILPTEKQYKFIRYILPLYILHNIDNIKEVIKIYNLNLHMVFCHLC
jgi:hypothetical protein